MLTQIDNGGSAFPIEADYVRGASPGEMVFEVEHQPGMTLADYFAGQWLAGFATRPESEGVDLKSIGVRAYAVAQSLIHERNEVEQ